jgi:hypothetical protein
MATVIEAPQVGTPHGRLASIRALLLVQQLLALDDLWTAEMERVTTEQLHTEADIEALTDLVDEMEAGLARLPTAAYEVRLMIEELSDGEFEASFARMLEGHDELRSSFADDLPDFAPRGAVIVACDFVREKSSGEVLLLREKLEKVQRGEATPGDFLISFRCAGYLVGIGTTIAGAAVGTAMGGPLAPAALGLVYPAISFIEDWKDRGCRVQLPEISFGRRG